MSDENIIDNAPLVAVCDTKGLYVEPFLKDDGRVAFRVSGDLEAVINAIYRNDAIPIGDFLKSLGKVRNAIFTLKNMKMRR